MLTPLVIVIAIAIAIAVEGRGIYTSLDVNAKRLPLLARSNQVPQKVW